MYELGGPENLPYPGDDFSDSLPESPPEYPDDAFEDGSTYLENDESVGEADEPTDESADNPDVVLEQGVTAPPVKLPSYSSLEGIITVHQAPGFIPASHREGHDVTFGDADNLPDESVLQGLNWYDNELAGSELIAAIPNQPDAVVRIQPVPYGDAESYRAIAQEGVRNFSHMTDSGLVLPAQRFVVAPAPHIPGSADDGAELLYTITERIEGRPLSKEPHDATHAPALIEAHAAYLLEAYNSPDTTRFLWDKGKPRQHTLTAAGNIVMQDVGLEFRDFDWTVYQNRYLFRVAVNNVYEWAANVGIEPPDNLQQLIAIARTLTDS